MSLTNTVHKIKSTPFQLSHWLSRRKCSFFHVTCPEALITNFMVRKWNINKKWFLHFAIKHNRDVSNALTVRFIDLLHPHRFRFDMLTGNGKCDCIFRAHLIFFLFLLFSHFPSTEWIYWCYEFYILYDE